MRWIKKILLIITFIAIFSFSNERIKSDPVVYINNQKDFDKYKNKEFEPGTHILFAAGKMFNGQFAPQGTGTKEKLIKISAYNPKSKEVYWDDIENKPVINGHGTVN